MVVQLCFGFQAVVCLQFTVRRVPYIPNKSGQDLVFVIFCLEMFAVQSPRTTHLTRLPENKSRLGLPFKINNLKT